VLSPDTKSYPGTDYYEIIAKQFTQTLHPAIGPTRLWGYGGAKEPNNQYLGGVIVATHGRPVKLKLTNLLPSAHLLPLDPTAVDPPLIKEVGGRADASRFICMEPSSPGPVMAAPPPGSRKPRILADLRMDHRS
jgi:FtsP/CotA-like multicopper oxidase with cupredoxin domain